MKKFVISIAAILMSGNILAQEDGILVTKHYYDRLPVISQNIEWQRDVYREIDLRKNVNSGLFVVQNNQNLLTRIFEHIVNGDIKAYEFAINRNEEFTDANVIKIKNILDDYHINYKKNAALSSSDIDIPTDEVLSYYIKESVIYDKVNGRYRIFVDAVCPVINREDDFNDKIVKYPLFWVKLKDIAPYIDDIEVYANDVNMATRMNVYDYFTLNLYQGNIYKVFNPAGNTLNQMVESEEQLKAERERIEDDLHRIRRHTFDTFYESKLIKIEDSSSPARVEEKLNNKKK